MLDERQQSIETVRIRLKQRRLQLLHYVASLTGVDVDELLDPADELRSLDTAGWMMLGPLANELDRIDHALTRIRDGRYGECRNCRAPIVVERLELNPLSELCLGCQVDQDISWRFARKEWRPAGR